MGSVDLTQKITRFVKSSAPSGVDAGISRKRRHVGKTCNIVITAEIAEGSKRSPA